MQTQELDPGLFRGANPFRDLIVREPWTTPQDATEVHDGAGCALTELVEATARDHRSRLALLVGASGAGKSHLLGRLRRRLGERAFFVFVDPYVRPDRALGHLRVRLVQSLWRADRAFTRRPLERLMDQAIERAIERSLGISAEAYLTERPGPLAPFWQRLRIEVRSGAFYRDRARAGRAAEVIRHALGAAAPQADEAMLAALVAARTPGRAAGGLAWLRGAALDAGELEALGIPGGDGDGAGARAGEDEARRLIGALAALTRGAGPLVICFDQTESLPGPGGRADLGHLLRLLDGLRDAGPNLVLVATCLGELLRAAGQVPAPDLRVDLRGLGEGAARALVSSRVAASLEPAALPYPGYPFEDRFYEQLGGPMPAREILVAAARELDRLRREAGAVAAPAEGPASEEAAAHWRAVAADAAERAAEEPEPTADVLAWSLETLLAWRADAGVGGIGEPDEPPPGLDRAWRRPDGERVAVAISDTGNGRAFLKTVRDVRRALESGALDRALLVRCGDIPERWRSAPRELATLGEAGGLVAALDDASRDALLTVRHLRLAADAGDLRHRSGVVASADDAGCALAQLEALPAPPIVDLLEGTHGA